MLKSHHKTLKRNNNTVKGKLVTLENALYYKISNCDKMRPFFMTILSDSNHWMFISSNGGLTAGRKNAEFSLFPYYTDDKITEMAETTGSKSIFKVFKNDELCIWEPFSIRQTGLYKIQRNLYKSVHGNKVVFEEVNIDLELTYRYQWNSSKQFGFVKQATFINNSQAPVKVTLLDGLQNILPALIGPDVQNTYSNLVDAYKKNELETSVNLGIYALSAVIVDKAEPSEALKANTVWSLGLDNPTCLISSLQLDNFRSGLDIYQETDIRAEKGAYFMSSTIVLEPKELKRWWFVANVNQSVSDCVNLAERIKIKDNLPEYIQQDIDAGTQNLIDLSGGSDGLQLSNDPLVNIRHFSNTLFNIMRGGIFDDNYKIEKLDFLNYISKANKTFYYKRKAHLEDLPDSFSVYYLKNLAETDVDNDFKRLSLEYLPLKFSRRHGDPSRPWNKFSINTTSEIDGSKILDYQGNWRDIFQNWEALAHAYPEFMEGMIHKFLNASTFDGYNPYRVTKDGFDWETIEADDPWSYIGYWGDHQIIYLLKFLEFMEDYFPGALEKRFNENIFVYANVPYKIKNYQSIVKNPKDTIDFDYHLDHHIQEKRRFLGSDGALLEDQTGQIYKVNLIEKLLATLLSKISNFIPEAGIWMNTQRPEWNDANNALVGNGVSMVTLYYLNRFLDFFESFISKSQIKSVQLSNELLVCFHAIVRTLKDNKDGLSGMLSNRHRKNVMDGLGNAGSQFRETIYDYGFSNSKSAIFLEDITAFIKLAKAYITHSIAVNKRQDNMYHAYNILTILEDEVSISYLSEMLEGQVAILSSGHLNPSEALSLLDGLKSSALFRADQYSYILYPNKTLPRFLEKNNIPSQIVEQSKLLNKLINDGNTQIIQQDVKGDYHFHASFNNANYLKEALSLLPEVYQALVKTETELILQSFEAIFNHKSFTGRSGTFFGYEGLGSIYWHMVSKLLLAVQENCWLAINRKESDAVIGKLLEHYYEIKAGIGVHKSPELYGAFPTDAYSHTPGTKGAQQPGMTGQVKEDLLSRFGELGVFVKAGQLGFNTRLLLKQEFLKESTVFSFTNVLGHTQEIVLPPDSLVFTYAQVPIIYKLSNKQELCVVYNTKKQSLLKEMRLDKEQSKSIFQREGLINRIEVFVIK